VAAELAFGLPGARIGAVAVKLPDGRSVRFRGKADRIDMAEDGTLEVIDYKTGGSGRYGGLSEAEPDARGTRLQLVVYALAGRLFEGAPEAPVRADYWFVSDREGFKRVGYPVTPEVLDRVRQTVGQIVSGIEHGVFPNYPTATSTSPFVECAYCDPDALGVVELRHRLERKRADPALAGFFTLAEPPPPEARDEGDGPGA
jgi:RecB family exonuclease